MKTFADINKTEVRFAEGIINDDGVKVIKINYFDNEKEADEIPYDEDQLRLLDQYKDNNRTRRNLDNKSVQITNASLIDEELNKTNAEVDKAVAKDPSLKEEAEKVKAAMAEKAEEMKNSESDNIKPTTKEKVASTLVKVGAGVAVGVGALALITVLKGCSTDDKEPTVEPVIETVDETAEVEEPTEDMVDTVIDYDRAIKDIKAMTNDYNTTLAANGQDTVDAESYAAFYNWLNMENIDPMSFLQEQKNNIIPVGPTEGATTSFMAIDTIGHNNTLYMYGEDVKMISLLPYVVDPDNQEFVRIVEDTEKEIRELSIKEANGTITDEDKERATEIYDDIYNYLRSQGGSAFGNHNNHNEGVTKMVDMTIMNSMLQALGKAGFINQDQINAIIGKDIDPATGEAILRTPLNDWANAMGEWNRLCDAANSYVYAVPEEEAQGFTYGK